jgi:hypothetical protein
VTRQSTFIQAQTVFHEAGDVDESATPPSLA